MATWRVTANPNGFDRLIDRYGFEDGAALKGGVAYQSLTAASGRNGGAKRLISVEAEVSNYELGVSPVVGKIFRDFSVSEETLWKAASNRYEGMSGPPLYSLSLSRFFMLNIPELQLSSSFVLAMTS
ncbi:hypothetical protein LshimejAT787_0401760 [Lyophyllum shimeji]|uniref:Uncharacterized protein n=1 Tax=Lyophyllum shimeji TaxID=47721 RepID=A0A9P3PJ31_LYOSH|nr:hypothetical protein LshimejAT787_0401760 [Lyophyllum shimeji]